MEELLLHNETLDCWMVIYGIVYDVTDYAPFHPNPHFVTDYCGMEVTELFDGPWVVKVVERRIKGRYSNSSSSSSLLYPDTKTNDTTMITNPKGDPVAVPTRTPVTALGNPLSD
jgi:Cytochrome b5-like Heme/Steroid binding domain